MNFKIVAPLIFLQIIVSTNGESSENMKYDLIDLQNMDLSRSFFKTSEIKNFGESSTESNFNNIKCSADIFKIRSGIKKFEIWALQFVDSWGKIPPGILWGHFRDLGNFDECLKISKDRLKGKYCTAKLPMNPFIEAIGQAPPELLKKELNLRLGICVPNICSEMFLDKMIKNIIEDKLKITINETIIAENSCKQQEDIVLETVDWIAIVLSGIIALLIFLSTVYDYVTEKSGKIQKPLLISFSIITNGKKLFRIQHNRPKNVIECLDGIRCFSIVWVVFGHSFLMIPNLNNINGLEIAQWSETAFSMIILNGTVSVDSFLFLSGLLLVWTHFREMEKRNGKLNVPLMYFHRYVRLTPVLAATVLFVVSFYRYIGSGPMWETTAMKMSNICSKTWWSTLLYVQNYVHPFETCMGHSWYLAVDTQLYVLSPIILITLWKWGKKMILPITVLGFLSIACSFTTFMNGEFKFKFNDRALPQNKLIYFPTHTRYAPWLVGVVFGYLLYLSKDKVIKLSKIFILIGWLISLGTLISIIFGPLHRYLHDASIPPTYEGAIYTSFSRTAWVIALAWIVFACHNGYGGVVNSILSFKVWQPFGRLTYSIYITHIIIQNINHGLRKSDSHFSNYETILNFWSDFGITVCVSIVTVLAFELPIVGIENVLFDKGKQKPKVDNIGNSQEVLKEHKEQI